MVLGQLSRKSVPRGEKSPKTSEVLAKYEELRKTVLSADTSSYSLGLGAVLHQKQPNGELQPVAYISRALTQTEQHYAQLKKEALAIRWDCSCFQDYLLGKTFKIETDHKPSVPLLSTKPPR